jgi:hypothetical protein
VRRREHRRSGKQGAECVRRVGGGAGAYQPRVAFANWMPSRMPASIQFWMANSTMMAIQIMIGMGPHTAAGAGQQAGRR